MRQVLGWLLWAEAMQLQMGAVRQLLSWADSFWKLPLEVGVGLLGSPACPSEQVASAGNSCVQGLRSAHAVAKPRTHLSFLSHFADSQQSCCSPAAGLRASLPRGEDPRGWGGLRG